MMVTMISDTYNDNVFNHDVRCSDKAHTVHTEKCLQGKYQVG